MGVPCGASLVDAARLAVRGADASGQRRLDAKPQALPIVLLGFDTTVLVAYVPVLAFYSIFVHANVPWTFGPFRYLLASPVFHRWHHAVEVEGASRNLAGMFPAIDLVFGTFHMPAGRSPERFGVVDDDVPAGLLAQLWYPVRAGRAGRTAAVNAPANA